MKVVECHGKQSVKVKCQAELKLTQKDFPEKTHYNDDIY